MISVSRSLKVFAAYNLAVGAGGTFFAGGYLLALIFVFGGGIYPLFAFILTAASVSYAISGLLLRSQDRSLRRAGLRFHLATVVLGLVYCAILLVPEIRNEMVERTHEGRAPPENVYYVFHLPGVIVLFAGIEWIFLRLAYRSLFRPDGNSGATPQ